MARNVDECNPTSVRGEMRFYHRAQPGFYLSNFYPSPFMCDGQMYGSSEAYFQSRKFLHEPPIAKKVASAPSARDALTLARAYHLHTRADWSKVSVGEMYDACFLKFVNNPRLRAQLIATGEAHLVEAAPEDYFWGEGQDKTGRNELGHVLVAVREALKANTESRSRVEQAALSRSRQAHAQRQPQHQPQPQPQPQSDEASRRRRRRRRRE
ncbi:hypothetical protein OC844_007833 [Tilletia horrida]|nr:hypothetical protein OC844_007833 [Tilletia horrida]